ncbi:hypothetical protein ZWY2020_047338 [Hordeum vulgare]|nr:hypothetical protein ZWY2020_047338 [Hordeum vulgare]
MREDGGVDDAMPSYQPGREGVDAAMPNYQPGREGVDDAMPNYHRSGGVTEAKKRRLERINQRKLELLAEQAHHRLKKRKAKQIPSTLGINEGPSTSKNTNLDLNHDSGPAYCQEYQDHPEPGMHDQAGVDEDIMASNVNLYIAYMLSMN